MKRRLVAATIVLTLAACGREERPWPVSASAAHLQDLDGQPDLIVDARRLATSWVIYDQDLPAGFCSVQEGDVTPGVHRVLRFTVTTPNVGTADLFVGNPLDHVAANDGLFEFASCHDHFHFRNYATYQLVGAGTGQIFLARKRGFCMIDVTPWRSDAPPMSWVYRVCGTLSRPGNQGISVGYADTYFKDLGGQYFLLDDPEAPIPPGEYLIRITVNPAFACGPDDAARPRDALGFCHMFAEGDYTNNVGEARVTIPDRVGRTGFGPGAGGLSPDREPADDEGRPRGDGS